MGFFGLFKSQKENGHKDTEAHDVKQELHNKKITAEETFEEKDRKRLKRILKFEIVMFFYSYIFTVYFCAIFKITPLFNNSSTFRNIFVGDLGTNVLMLLIISCLALGYIFYKLKGLVNAFLICLFSPLAAFFLTLCIWFELDQWMYRKKFERLSPEEQERILDEQLSLDYKYSSRGP